MPSFDASSTQHLSQAHPLLQKLMNEAIKEYLFIVMDAMRGRAAQEDAVRRGASKVHFGDSAHNYVPAVALDIAPSPLDWSNRKAFAHLQLEIIKPIAKKLNIPIRQGIDFNMDGNLTDDNFVDLPHVELYPWRDFAKGSKLVGQ